MAKRRLNERRRAELLGEFEASGLTAAAFCRARGLGYGAFLRWRRAPASKAGSAEPPRFVEVEFTPAASAPPAEGRREPVAELDLGAGVTLRFYPIREARP